MDTRGWWTVTVIIGVLYLDRMGTILGFRLEGHDVKSNNFYPDLVHLLRSTSP